MGFLKFIAGLIATLAGSIAIYQFVTGYDSFGEMAREAYEIVQLEPKMKSSPQQTIKRVRLERYTPFFRQDLGNGSQEIWALEPGHFLPFTRPESIVRLVCDESRKCEGTRILPVPSNMKHIAVMAPDRARREILFLDRYGQGAVYRADDSTYFEFQIDLPCTEYSNYTGGTSATGGKFSIHKPVFKDNVLTFRAHGSQCQGRVLFGSDSIRVPVVAVAQAFETFAFDLLIEAEFDAAGFITTGRMSACQISQYDRRLPPWFSLSSTSTGQLNEDASDAQCSNPNRVEPERLVSAMTREAIATALRNYSNDRLHVAPDVPPAFLALAQTLTDEPAGNIVAVVDDTLSRKADRILIFSTNGVYSRQPSAPAKFLDYATLSRTTPEDSAYGVLYGTFNATALRVDETLVRELIATASDAAIAAGAATEGQETEEAEPVASENWLAPAETSSIVPTTP